MGLQINKLIEVAEEIISDEQIGLAAEITKPVQNMKDEFGTIYQLQIKITCIEQNILPIID